jgi:Tol biopolymer transport system component
VKFNEANLSWSADGVYLGYEVLLDGFRKIMLKDLAGNYSRELQVIPKGPNNFLDGMVVKSAQSYNAGLRWSRDSTRFAFMSNGGVGEYNIYVGAIGAKEKAIANSPTKDGYATWSPSTNEIAFVSGRTGNGDIYLVDLGTKNVTQLSQRKEVDIFPEWFPNGNRIVYSSGDALNHDLHVVERTKRNEAWSKPAPLTAWDHDDLRPTVSPDGRYVAFYADDGGPTVESRRWNIMVVPFVPGKTYRAEELRDMVVAKDVVIDLNTGPAWSPDSRKIFYVKRDPSVANPIYAYDLFTGRSYVFKTNTRMNRDILMSKVGILSFRAQVGVWDRVFVALTNQGLQLQNEDRLRTKIHYLKL